MGFEAIFRVGNRNRQQIGAWHLHGALRVAVGQRPGCVETDGL